MRRALRAYSPLLGILGILLGLLGVDVYMNAAVTRRVSRITGNAMRSVELVSDLGQAGRELAAAMAGAPAVSAGDRLRLLQRFDDLSRQVESLDSSPAQLAEWQRLKQAMAQLLKATPDRVASDAAVVAAAVTNLAAINRESARAIASEIGDLGNQEIVVDAVGVGIALVLLSLVAFAHILSTRREVALLTQNIALVEEKNADLDAFASRAAHDLRAPLSPIRGYADLIVLGDEPPGEVRELAARIRKGVDRLARVIDDMLELSRLGHPPPGRSVISNVWADVIEELGPELRAATCTTDLTPEPIKCAPSVLAQILRNVVGNAVKYRSPNRPLELRITAAVVGDRVFLEVTDNGIGIDPESASHAFEPFFRARSDIAGHGLGLAIVDRAARAVGGVCRLSSNVDQGTRVTVELPRAPEHD